MNAVPLPPGMTPRQWQIEAMAAIYQGMADYNKILVSAATGTGKGSLIAAFAVRESRNDKRLLFLVHRDELIDDVMARAKATYPGIDAGKVKGPLNQIDRQIVFASVQSLRGRRLAELGHFDFVVTDEAHHGTAPSYLQIYYQIEKVNPNWKHVGFTATPFRYGGVGKTAGLGKAFQRLVYEYPLAQAIADGALCPLRGVAVETHLDLSGVDPDNVDRLANIVDTPSRNQIVAAKYLELAAGKSAICFSVTVDHAAHLAQAMIDAGVEAEAVWGTDSDRAAKIARYKAGTTQVLCNCELLTEGFDAPQTEAVILVRPTGSIGLYSQMVGRVTRLFPGKSEGLVIDFVGNAAKYPLVRLSDLTTPVAPVETDLRRDGAEVQEQLTPPNAVGSEHAPVDLFARPKATFYGYARGANSHELAPHTAMIRAAGVALLRIDLLNESTELTSMMNFMRRGDVLVVSHIGHLSDSMDGVNIIMQEMVSKGIELRMASVSAPQKESMLPTYSPAVQALDCIKSWVARNQAWVWNKTTLVRVESGTPVRLSANAENPPFEEWIGRVLSDGVLALDPGEVAAQLRECRFEPEAVIDEWVRTGVIRKAPDGKRTTVARLGATKARFLVFPNMEGWSAGGVDADDRMLLTPDQRTAVQRAGIEKARQEGVYTGRPRPRKVQDNDVTALLDGGMNKSAVARTLGISRETVHRCIRRVKSKGVQ